MNNIDLKELASGWSDITIKVLQVKIATLKIRKTGDLFKSLNFNVNQTGDDYIQMYLSYNIYGKFVDMGVGRNYAIGNSGRVDAVKKQRNRKEWYSRTFYAQVMRLGELARQQAGEQAVNKIVSTIHAVRDLKYNQYQKSN